MYWKRIVAISPQTVRQRLPFMIHSVEVLWLCSSIYKSIRVDIPASDIECIVLDFFFDVYMYVVSTKVSSTLFFFLFFVVFVHREQLRVKKQFYTHLDIFISWETIVLVMISYRAVSKQKTKQKKLHSCLLRYHFARMISNLACWAKPCDLRSDVRLWTARASHN